MKSKLVPVLFLILINLTCFGQKSATIGNVDFNFDQDRSLIIITYSIEKYRPDDRFNIYPVVRKSTGEKVNAVSFTGDLIGVTGGPDKRIAWDLAKDNIILDDEIYVEVTGERIVDSVVDGPGEKLDMGQSSRTKSEKDIKPVNRTGLFFESLAFPGWGTSRLTGKNGHFVKGALGYGTLIGSLLMTIKASDSYDAYRRSEITSERDVLFNEAKNNNKLSMILAGSAAAIWSVDLISVLVIKDKSDSSLARLININVGYNLAAGHSHQLSCRINF